MKVTFGTSQLSGSTHVDNLLNMKVNGLGFVLYLFFRIRKSDRGSVHGHTSLLESNSETCPGVDSPETADVTSSL